MFRDDAQRWAVTDGPIGQALNEELFNATTQIPAQVVTRNRFE
jgi:hypothetical protein